MPKRYTDSTPVVLVDLDDERCTPAFAGSTLDLPVLLAYQEVYAAGTAGMMVVPRSVKDLYMAYGSLQVA